MFAVNTNNKDDLDYLEELLAANPQYKKHKAEKDYAMWMGNWETVQRENLYIKIDDDVVGSTIRVQRSPANGPLTRAGRYSSRTRPSRPLCAA
jgi:hypothetical protein